MKSSAYILVDSLVAPVRRGDVLFAPGGCTEYIVTGKETENAIEVVNRRDILREMPYLQFRRYRREGDIRQLWNGLISEFKAMIP